MNVKVKTRKTVGKPVQPHPFSRQNFAISFKKISAFEFASLQNLFENCNENHSLAI